MSETVNEFYVDGSKVVHPAKNFYTMFGKRFLDIVFSFIGIIITLPINIIIMIITLFDVGLPIIFKQTRIGKNNKEFTIYKFRNMTNAKDENGNLLPAKQRVTKFGRFVRKTSLDELLQFYLIFIGKMSIIGPRPLVKEYLPYYTERHRQRHAVRPGLECPPHSKNTKIFMWEDRFENDIWYVENLSFLTDIKMFFMIFLFMFNRNNNKAREDVSKSRGNYFSELTKKGE